MKQFTFHDVRIDDSLYLNQNILEEMYIKWIRPSLPLLVILPSDLHRFPFLYPFPALKIIEMKYDIDIFIIVEFYAIDKSNSGQFWIPLRCKW